MGVVEDVSRVNAADVWEPEKEDSVSTTTATMRTVVTPVTP